MSGVGKTVAKNLQTLRGITGLSCREVAVLADRSPGTISQIERTKPDVAGSTLLAIADVFGCTVDWLAAGRGCAPSDRQVVASVKEAREAAGLE